MKAKFSVDAGGYVTLEYVTAFGDPVTRVFFTESAGDSYVCEQLEYGRQQQVCEFLRGYGNTLRATRGALVDTIRREYRRMKRAGISVAIGI
jgi:hypothetical protein